MRAPTDKQLLAARNRFFFGVAAMVATLAFIHLAPKPIAPRDMTRFIYTLAYYAALIGLCRLLSTSRSRFLRLIYEWQYEDCPETLRRIYADYLFSLDQIFSATCGVMAIFFVSSALDTMSLWYPGIGALSLFYTLGWWFGLVGMFVLPFMAGSLFTQARQHRLVLKRELANGYFKPRPLRDLGKAAKVAKAPAVEVVSPKRFRAGGRDWDWENLTQNILIFGQPGSGKTICVLNALLDGMIGCISRAPFPGAALILDPKGDFNTKIRTLCRRHNRLQDLVVIDPSNVRQSMHWNPLDSDDDELELSNTFSGVLEALGMQNTQDTFWIDSAKRFIRHSIRLLRMTNPPGEPPGLLQIAALCSSFGAIADRTDLLDPSNDHVHDTLQYFAEWTQLPDQTRSSIQAQLTNMLDPFSLPPYDLLFSGLSTLRLDKVLSEGKILYVNIPMADRPAMAKTIGTFIKLEYFRQVLRAIKKERQSFFFCDEFQNYFTPRNGLGDNAFFDKSRQSNHANVIATQNMPSILMQTSNNENLGKNLISLFAVKVFLRNSDEFTNNTASGLFGQDLVGTGGGTVAGMSIWRRGKGGFSASANMSQQRDAAVAVERFSQLDIPSRTHGIDHCESIVHDSTAPVVDRHPKKLKWKVHPIDDEPAPRTAPTASSPASVSRPPMVRRGGRYTTDDLAAV